MLTLIHFLSAGYSHGPYSFCAAGP